MLTVTSLQPGLDKSTLLLGRAKMVILDAALSCHMWGSMRAYSDQSSWCMHGFDFRVCYNLGLIPPKLQNLY